MFKANMGSWDRIVRAVVGIVLLYLSLTGVLAGAWAWVGGIVAVVFLATSLVSFCPLYTLFKFSTKKS